MTFDEQHQEWGEAAYVVVSEQTLLERDRARVDPTDLRVGQRVEVWVDPGVGESDPVTASGVRIVILAE